MDISETDEWAASIPDDTVGIQVRCRFDPELHMFRVSESKGKALSSGGFGVTIPSKAGGETSERSSSDGVHSSQYLFIEEVLFLYDRGLLECLHQDNDILLQQTQLYEMLPKLNLRLPLYLVYAHLRDQDFRVLRHSPERYYILQQQERMDRTDGPQCSNDERGLRHQVRASVAEAPAPCIDHGGLSISWDVYNPSAEFAKTHPGFPDFYVAVAYFNESHVRFSEVEELVKHKCHGIPLKVATVSDFGTVVMFGATDYGVPTIQGRRDDKTEP
jgi:tRNA-splicing endonuclease subunit sen54 N-term